MWNHTQQNPFYPYWVRVYPCQDVHDAKAFWWLWNTRHHIVPQMNLCHSLGEALRLGKKQLPLDVHVWDPQSKEMRTLSLSTKKQQLWIHPVVDPMVLVLLPQTRMPTRF
jgi:hypothetical protein